ncbi:MAG: HAMP domain-containing histidine kinase [Proteobacteria bacterium]|nr:HAMP domain-containing histidine kinase [Pseudomonadota bacterium]
MSVRVKLTLTIVATGVVTILLVIATVLYAFRRFEHETEFRRGNAFLERVVAMYDNLFELHQQSPDEFQAWLRTMVLFEPDTQLYLLDPAGTVLASSGHAKLAPGFKVAIEPVREALMHPDMPYVMGDDPERMDADAVIAVQPVKPMRAASADPLAGYLYLVAHTEQLPEGRWDALRMSFAQPVLGLLAAVCAVTTLLAALITASVTRPLRQLTDAVSHLSQHGLDGGAASARGDLLPPATRDEFGQLTRAFETMLATLRRQWGALRRLDHFRREGVSNLSHDLRSPLTATVGCLEMLEQRWSAAGAVASAEERRLVEVALRNTRNAARLVQSLGELAQLDEPEFKLRTEVVDAAELLDDICLRFAERAAQRGVTVEASHPPGGAAAPAALDVELFERAVANLVDNALKFCPAGARITLAAVVEGGRVRVSVDDTGPGIAPADLPHLFDRHYQSRQNVAPATGEGGKGLGLAIVKRIAELHGGDARVDSAPGRGTAVVLDLPAAHARNA